MIGKEGSIPGSGPLGAVLQICWFGQPAHASALPADSDFGPGQCSGAGSANSDMCTCLECRSE